MRASYPFFEKRPNKSSLICFCLCVLWVSASNLSRVYPSLARASGLSFLAGLSFGCGGPENYHQALIGLPALPARNLTVKYLGKVGIVS